MFTARRDQQIIVDVQNQIGTLAKLAKLVAEHGINMLAVSGTGHDSQGRIGFITDDNLRAADALRENGHEASQQHVILLDAQHKPGLLRRVTETLAREGINIHQLYASALSSQDHCLVVIHTDDDERALVLLSD